MTERHELLTDLVLSTPPAAPTFGNEIAVGEIAVGEVRSMGVQARRQLDLPVVTRNHYAAPRLAEEQGRMALRLGLELQAAATVLAPEQTRALERRHRRRRVRLAVTVCAVEVAAGLAAVGAAAGWWPNPLA